MCVDDNIYVYVYCLQRMLNIGKRVYVYSRLNIVGTKRMALGGCEFFASWWEDLSAKKLIDIKCSSLSVCAIQNYISLFLSLSISHTHTNTLYLYLSLSVCCLSVTLPLSFSLSLSHTHTHFISLSFSWPVVGLSLSLSLSLSLYIYEYMHMLYTTRIHMQNTKYKYKTPAKIGWFCCFRFINFWLSDNGDTRRETQFLNFFFKNYTLLTILSDHPQHAAHLVILRFPSVGDPKNPTTCLKDRELNSMPQWQKLNSLSPWSKLHCLFQNAQILRSIPSGHDAIHTAAPFPAWGYIKTMVIVISFARERKTAPNDYYIYQPLRSGRIWYEVIF